MVKTRIALALVACAMAAAASAQSSVYRWVDKDGKVHYSSEPPPGDAANVTQKRMGGGGADEGQLPYATQQAMKSNPVTLYVSNNCGELCADGRSLKCLTVIDEFTRECLAIDVAGGIRSGRVIEVLTQLASVHGAPRYLRSAEEEHQVQDAHLI